MSANVMNRTRASGPQLVAARTVEGAAKATVLSQRRTRSFTAYRIAEALYGATRIGKSTL